MIPQGMISGHDLWVLSLGTPPKCSVWVLYLSSLPGALFEYRI